MAEVPWFVSLAVAQAIVREHIRPLPAVEVDLAAAQGLTLAAPVRCDLDVPPFDRALMDGYAVRSLDVGGASTDLGVAGRIAAGTASAEVLAPGSAVQINTGAPIPPGADAVVKVEDVQLSPDGRCVTVPGPVRAGVHVCPRAAYVAAGTEVLQPGQRLNAAQIAVAATAGAARVSVHRRPKVAVLVTGDELVEVADRPGVGQIRDSNGPTLQALLLADGAEALVLGRVGDDRALLAERIRDGLDGDVLCVSGGVSMGAFDFVPEVLQACGVTLGFAKMATKPGRPTLFGTTDRGSCVFGLPGNPVSAFVGYWMLVRPALALMQGRQAWPVRLRAKLSGHIAAARKRMSFWPARVVATNGELESEPLRWGGSGDPFGMARANALIVRDAESPAAEPGAFIEVIMLNDVI